MEDWIEAAKVLLQRGIGSIESETSPQAVQRSCACALIAIAERLDKIVESQETEIVESQETEYDRELKQSVRIWGTGDKL